MPLNPQTTHAGRGADGGTARPERLRVGVRQLPAPDIMLVRAFVQMSSTFTENFPWVFAEEPPFDLVLVDAGSRPRPHDAAEAVLLITDGGAPSRDMMQRPLRYRVLEDWLKQRAAEIHAAGQQLPTPPNAAGPLGGHDFYVGKLLRWPPSALLQHDRLRLRIATILGASGMNLSDLAKLCRQPPGEVQDCVQAFLDAGLLQTEASPRQADAQPAAVDWRRELAPASRKPRPGLGLIASIRRRLGL